MQEEKGRITYNGKR